MSGKNLRVNLIANTSKFKAAMSETSNQIKLLNSEFRSAAAETDQFGNKLDSTGAKKKQLSGVIEQYKNRIKAITEEQKHWTNELKKGSITETEHAQKQQELARRLNNTEGEMKKYEGQLKKLNSEGKKVTKTYADFDKQFRNVGTTMRNVGAQVGITAGIGFMGMKRVLSDVIDEAKNFESGMSRVEAISSASGDSLALLKDQALELNKTTVFTAEQAAAGMEKLALAGWKAEAIYQAMPGMLDLAAAGSLELATAADITSDTMQSFGLSADKATHSADVFAYAQANANTSVEQMGEAMKYLAPTANSLGWTLEESAAIIMKLADNGLKGSMATQAFGSSLVRLSAPTPKATKLIKKLGLEFFDAEGKMKPMPEVVAEMEKGLKGMSEEQKAATMDVLVGKNAFKQWQIVLKEGSESLDETTNKLETADGAAKNMADTMLDNAQGAIIRMQSALSGLKIELGEKLLPIISKAAEWIGDLSTKLSDMDESTLETIAHGALLVTAVLGVTTAVAGLVTGIGALMAFAGPVGLAIVGGTALLGGLAAIIYKNSVETKKLAEEQRIAKQDALNYGAGLSEGTKKGVQGYNDLYENAKIKMVELRNMSGDEATKTVKEIQQAFSQMADVVIAELEVQRDELSRVINEIYGTVGEAGTAKAEQVTNEVLALFDKDIADYKKARDTINKIIEEYGSNWADYPPKIQAAYDEAYAIMDKGAAVFAGTQKEMQAIQERIVEQGGAIQNKQAKEFNERINSTYESSLDAIRDHYNDRREVLDQGLAQEKISADQHAELMKGLEAQTAGMYADAGKKRNEALQDLIGHVDKRGELLDLATNKELERLEVDEYVATAAGLINLKRAETDEEYFNRWLSLQEETLKNTEAFADNSNKVHRQQQVEFLESLGYTKDEAIIIAQEMVNASNAELGKGNEEAKAAGEQKGTAYQMGLDDSIPGTAKSAEEIIKAQNEELKKGETEVYDYGNKKGKAYRMGLDDSKPSNVSAAEQFSKATDDGLSKGKPEAKQHGTDKGTAHKVGIESTKSANKQAADNIKKSTDDGLKQGKTEAGSHGKEKGDAHRKGLELTRTPNMVASTAMSTAVSSILGKTTDNGGGAKAGGLFITGIRNQMTGAYNAGSSVSASGKRGLESVKTSSAGSAFVSGFRGSISTGGGSVWTAAWNLGKSALSALKKSIDSHSPSKLTGKEGVNFTDGFAISIDKSKRKSINAASSVGKESVEALNKEVTGFKRSFGAIALAVEDNKQILKVEHEINNSGLESKIASLENALEKLIDVMVKKEGTNDPKDQTIVMNINVRNNDDINKIDNMLSNLGNRRQAAWGGGNN